MKHQGEYLKIPLEFISLDMNVYTPSLLPFHIVTLYPDNHWNREKKFYHHQIRFRNLSSECKIRFIEILLKMLKRQYIIDITGDGGFIICDYGPFNADVYNPENKLSNENHSVPCLIGDNLKPFKNKLAESAASCHYFSDNDDDNYYLDLVFYSHAKRIAENTIQLLFNCTL